MDESRSLGFILLPDQTFLTDNLNVFTTLYKIEIWCNGSTRDFGSFSQGSSPCISTKFLTQTGSNGLPTITVKKVKSS